LTNFDDMAGNSFGEIFRLTTFGESHGPAIGGVIDGCPAGLLLDLSLINNDLQRRKPGQSSITTSRKEDDKFEILSGVYADRTTGSPIAFLIRNLDYKPSDYDEMKDIFRPSHADFTYTQKYGFRDYRGGGRSSARETAARVFAGAIAKQLLLPHGILITAFVSQVGKIKIERQISSLDLSLSETNSVRCPDEEIAKKMIELIEEVKAEGDTVGGIIHCIINNPVAGLGEPVFDKLHADLGKAMLSINAVHGFDYGSGFESVTMKGSQHNDAFIKNENGKIITSSNNSGGIQGGISNGMDIFFRVAFKPVSTIMKEQQSLNEKGEESILLAKGRHDPCVVPRAVPIVEAMAALVLADHLLRNKSSKFD
jgi:chorismate synthase